MEVVKIESLNDYYWIIEVDGADGNILQMGYYNCVISITPAPIQ